MSAALKMAAASTEDIVDTVQSSRSCTKLLTALKAAGVTCRVFLPLRTEVSASAAQSFFRGI